MSYIITLLLFGVFIRTAYAYLDPGTGSYVVQLVAASLIGSSVIIKLVWRSSGSFIKRLFLRKKNEQLEKKNSGLEDRDE